MTVFRSTDQSVAGAIRDVILLLAITPQTHLVARPGAQPGDPAIAADLSVDAYVDDPSRFIPGQLFSSYDETGEEDLAIADDWNGANPVKISFVGMDYQAFQFDHPAGTMVGTNLFTEVPNNIDAMLLGEDPLIYIVNLDQRDWMVGPHLIEPNFTMHIEYRRALVQPKAEGPGSAPNMNTNVWGMRQQRRCRADMELIARALTDNPSLATASGEHGISLGDPMNPSQEWFSKTWNKIIVDPNIQHFAAMGDFKVRGFREVFKVAS